LLPATIATLAALLMVKFAVLAEAVATNSDKPLSAMVNVANAASTERSPDAPAEHAPRPKPTAGNAPAAAERKPAASPPAPEGPPPVSESERALLQDLRQRRAQLDTRAETVASHEAVIAAAEQKISARVGELQALQKKLEGLDAAQKQKEEAGWQGLVKVYEVMKPKDAATIFNDLQMPVLLQVLDRMKEAKAAAVMAAMNPDKARDVTAELAQMRTSRSAAQTAPPASSPNPKGG
jgi:flagellar motility protein MotE (MotC chaperone)